MASRAKRKRPARRRAGGNLDLDAKILRLLGQQTLPGLSTLDKDDLDHIQAALKGANPTEPSNPNQGADEIDWRGGLDWTREQASAKTRNASQKIKVTFTGIAPDGSLSCECEDGKTSFATRIVVDAYHHTVGHHCNCEAPSYCRHVVAVATFGLSEMDNPESNVRKEIISQLGLVEDVTLIPGEEALKLLESLAISNSAEDDFEAKVDQESRILWRVKHLHSHLEIQPVFQKAKKRGGGYTKGRELSVETLLYGGERYPLTEGDRRALRTMEQNYFSHDIYEPLLELVGSDRVEFEGEPVTVLTEDFSLDVAEDGTDLVVKILPDYDRYFGTDGIVAIGDNEIKLVACNANQRQLAEHARFGNLRIPKTRKDALLERLQSVSKNCTVRLPSESVTKTEMIPVDPVLRLKSYKDGSLRCGVRVRLDNGLQRPGHGSLVQYTKTEQGLVQKQRDATAEMQAGRKIQDGIGFHLSNQITGEWDCRFSDFSESLGFLERLGSQGDELGVEALWDEDSEEPVNILGAITPANVRVEVSRKKDWFGVEGGFELNGEEFSLQQLLSAAESEPAEGYAQLKPGTWAKISNRLRKRLLELRDAAHANRSKLELDITAIPIIQSLQESELDIKADKEWQACVKRLEKSKRIRPNPSKTFNATLRDYQLAGYRWMRRLSEWGVGACLADDMGLGKTIQTLAVLVDRTKEGPALVIAPTSVGFNWQRETERFAPTLNPHLYRETERSSFLEQVTSSDVVICSYGLALRDAEHFAKVEWGTLVLDEAQFIKNARSKTSQAIRTFPAKWKLALTGTPIENHLGELWSLFRAVSPGLFGSWEQFRKRFAAPIEKNDDPERRKALSRRIQPFLLRRTKTEVLKDLPERTDINLHVDLSVDERRRYDEMRLAAIGEIEELVGLPDTSDQRFRVLAILTRLRQMACHIGLVDENWEGESSKLSLVIEKVRELREENHRVLIFSQFTKYLGLIRDAFESEGISYEYLDGQTPAKARQERVDRFQEGNTDAFLISLKAGGTGLNLTAADYVIHMDPWWNPAVEDQATDRSHRIGQERPVIVYRIISNGTIEEQILSLHADKRNLVSSVMEGTQKAGTYSTNQLLTLIKGE